MWSDKAQRRWQLEGFEVFGTICKLSFSSDIGDVYPSVSFSSRKNIPKDAQLLSDRIS